MKTSLTLLIEYLEMYNNKSKHPEIKEWITPIDKAKSLLEKEKNFISQAYEDGIKQHRRGLETDGEDYYNQMFNQAISK